jgi:hypothetical protein
MVMCEGSIVEELAQVAELRINGVGLGLSRVGEAQHVSGCYASVLLGFQRSHQVVFMIVERKICNDLKSQLGAK